MSSKVNTDHIKEDRAIKNENDVSDIMKKAFNLKNQKFASQKNVF